MIAGTQQMHERTCTTPPLRIALLGCGTVGSAFARLILNSSEHIACTHGRQMMLTRILVRDARRQRAGISSSLLTDDVNDVFADKPDVVVEALGGCTPAGTLVQCALERSVHVVSANKTLIAHHGHVLQAVAQRTSAHLAFEASVGAAVPVLASLRQRAAEPIRSLRAVVNGTCNFILTRMRDTGCDLPSVLGQAVAQGLAEPDPAADVSGVDSAEKLCILAREAGWPSTRMTDVQRAGIEGITLRDLDAAREHGCVVKLVAELLVTDTGAAPQLRVCPMFVPITHPLAKAKGAENVFVIEQTHGGRLVLHGEGAGPAPTAAALLSDVLRVLTRPSHDSPTRLTTSRIMRTKGRQFIRTSRNSPAATSLRSHSTHVHLRHDVIEAIVDDTAAAEPHLPDATCVPMLTEQYMMGAR